MKDGERPVKAARVAREATLLAKLRECGSPPRMPPTELWVVLAVVVAIVFLVLKKSPKATNAGDPTRAGGASAPSPNPTWRAVARALAEEFGLQHVAQQRLPDRVEGSLRKLEVRLTGTRTRVAREGARWPVFLLGAGDAEGDAPDVGDAAFTREVIARGLSGAHRAGLRDEATRAAVRRALALGVVCEEDALHLDHPAPPTEARPVQEALNAMLDLAAWLEAPNAPAGRDAWRPSPLAHLARRNDRDRRDGLRAWLAEVGAGVGPGELVEKQETMEWRGALGDRPFRLCLDDFEELQLELMRPGPWHELVLWNDPSVIPSPGAASAWDASDEVTVFVGRGTYFDGGAADVEQEVRAWESLSETLREAIVTGLREVGARSVVIEGRTVRLDWHASPVELTDPEGVVAAAVPLLQRLGDELPALTEEEATSDERPGWTRSTCRFCKTVFVWTTRSECPNCGGPVQG